MGKTLSIIGGVFTTAYLIGLGILIDGRWQELQGMQLNNLGDFLAGAFGPLAIVWLVLGYFQQGIELRQNSQALHLQAQELANSVEQQRELVKVARDQFEADRAAMQHQMEHLAAEQERLRRASRPKFAIANQGGSHTPEFSKQNLVIANLGQACTEVRLKLTGGQEARLSVTDVPMLDHQAKTGSTLIYPGQPTIKDYILTISYVDSEGLEGKDMFELTLIPSGQYFSPSFRQVQDQ